MHFLERREEGGVFRLGVSHRGDRVAAPVQGHAGRREATGQTGTHIGGIFGEIARQIPQLRQPVAVILGGAEGTAGAVVELAPETRIRIGRHLVAAEFFVRDQIDDLIAIDLGVDLLLLGQLVRLDFAELGQHILPISQPPGLGRGIDMRQMGRHRTGGVLVILKLGEAPSPFGLVQPLHLRIRRRGHRRHCDNPRGHRRPQHLFHHVPCSLFSAAQETVHAAHGLGKRN